jgi:hypothetical protein
VSRRGLLEKVLHLVRDVAIRGPGMDQGAKAPGELTPE